MKSKAHNPNAIPSVEENLARVEQLFASGRGEADINTRLEIKRSFTRAKIFAIKGDNAGADAELARIPGLRQAAGLSVESIEVRLQRAEIFAIQGKPRKALAELRVATSLIDGKVATGFMSTAEAASTVLDFTLVTAILDRTA